MSVTHATTASDPQTPRLGATDWNAAHTVNLTASDVGADASGAAAAALVTAEAYTDTKVAAVTTTTIGAVPVARTVTAGTGLTGGGALSGNITLNVSGLTIRTAAGVPSGAPTGTELPIAFNTTAVSGGIYLWNGSAWVLAAPIPPVVTPS